MAAAVRANGSKLIEHGILAESSWLAVNSLYADLRRQKDNEAWKLTVPREYAFHFNIVQNEKKIQFRPVVSVKGIDTDPQDENIFKNLDISLQVSCIKSLHHARWHFDKANEEKGIFQAGPLFHMQFGGHSSDQGEDFWLKEPRWAHAPMDLILLLEAVTANFFTDKWLTSVRSDPTWCAYVTKSEKLCLSAYIEKVSKAIQISSDTVLSALWATPKT
ncbi:hypothetical protein [Stenotrophomonas maltophilia]|uniref:hypothetical protein n=1 Tax=Stenotrophomonas maltophilia TaxID=40324 RepID=UPI0021C653CA|nr:hypothetical protein [Stenotrophomonas maltophilia]MCU1082922.1 hypothetical protein [Stenotrophomonas maltophilia]